MVRTADFLSANRSSILRGIIIYNKMLLFIPVASLNTVWRLFGKSSSIGRASHCLCEGCRFEPDLFRLFSNVVRDCIFIAYLKFTWEVTSHCGIEDFLWRSATIHYIVMYTNGRICFCHISKKGSMLNKNSLCKPAAKKDTIHNAVTKKFYLTFHREVMGSYASFDAAYHSVSTKNFSSGLII